MNRKDFIKSGAITLSLGGLSKLSLSEKAKLAKPKVVRATDGKGTHVIGDIQTLKLSGADTNGQVVVIEEENAPGTFIPMHTHSKEDEIFKVLEAELEVTVGDQTTVLKAGDLTFATKGVAHTWRVVGDQNCKAIFTAFPAGMELMFAKLGELPAGPPDFAQVAAICGEHSIEFV